MLLLPTAPDFLCVWNLKIYSSVSKVNEIVSYAYQIYYYIQFWLYIHHLYIMLPTKTQHLYSRNGCIRM